MKRAPLLSLIACLALASAASAAEVARTTLAISGMDCGGCVGAIKMQLKRTAGVTAYDVSYERRDAQVTYDPAQTDPSRIAASLSMTGFEAKVVPAAPQATAPPGGPAKGVPTVELSGLKAWFNGSSGSVRVVSILSPTCPECQCGHRAVKSVFDKTGSQDLKGFIVYLPMRTDDDPAAVNEEAATFVDKRLTEGWDGDRQVGNLFARTLKLRGTAWDVYLVYDRGVRWDGASPPVPSFWMHQLKAGVGADQKLCLNPERLSRDVIARLAKKG